MYHFSLKHSSPNGARLSFSVLIFSILESSKREGAQAGLFGSLEELSNEENNYGFCTSLAVVIFLSLKLLKFSGISRTSRTAIPQKKGDRDLRNYLSYTPAETALQVHHEDYSCTIPRTLDEAQRMDQAGFRKGLCCVDRSRPSRESFRFTICPELSPSSTTESHSTALKRTPFCLRSSTKEWTRPS